MNEIINRQGPLFRGGGRSNGRRHTHELTVEAMKIKMYWNRYFVDRYFGMLIIIDGDRGHQHMCKNLCVKSA